MAKAIGRPSGSNYRRDPNRTIVGICAPSSVAIEVRGANYSRRNITRGEGAVLTLVTNRTPVVEASASGSRIDGVSHGLSIREAALLTRLDLHGWSITGRHSFALPNSNEGHVIVGVDVEAIVAALDDGEGGVRSIDLVDLAGEEFAHVEEQRALVEFDLDGIVADIAQRDASFGVHAEGAGSDLDLSTRIFVRPNAIGSGHRPIQCARDPVIDATGLDRDFAAHVIEPRGTSRRIVFGA